MSSHLIPNTMGDLSITANRFVEGLKAHEKGIGVTQNTSTKIMKELAAAIARDKEYEVIRSERAKTFQPAVTKADADGRQFIGRAKKSLAVHLGEQWNETWIEAGFSGGTTRISSTIPGRETVLKELGAYFTAHPSHEVEEFGVTADRAEALYVALSGARVALETQATRQKDAKTALIKAISVLRKRLRAAIAELDMLLEPDSLIWGAVGLIPPAQKNRRRSKKTDAAPARSSTPAAAEGSASVALAV